MTRKIGTIGVGVRKSSYGKPRVEIVDDASTSMCGECREEFNTVDLYLCDDQLLCHKCKDELVVERDEISSDGDII